MAAGSTSPTSAACPSATTCRLAYTPPPTTPSPTATKRHASVITSHLHAHDAAHPREAEEHQHRRHSDERDAERVGVERLQVVRVDQKQERGQRERQPAEDVRRQPSLCC